MIIKNITYSIILFVMPLLAYSQVRNPISFENFTVENGISANAINQVIRDEKGFLWLATNNGLNRFDGLKFQVFTADKNNPNAIRGNNIKTILQDSKGYLWIGTLAEGLNRYNYTKGVFEAFVHNETDTSSISSNEILSLYEDKKGRLWVGTERGLNLFDYKTETFTAFLPNEKHPKAISSAAILSIKEDSRGWLWASTWAGGINLIIPTQKPNHFDFRHFKSVEKNPTQLPSDHVWRLFLDNKGRFWQTTFNGGLALMLPNEEKDPYLFQPQFISYNSRTNADENTRPSNDIIFAIDQSKNGDIWLGTAFGISIFNPDDYFSDLSSICPTDKKTIPKVKFQHLKHNVFNPQTLPSDDVRDIYFDDENIAWCSSMGGLSKYNPKSIRFQHFLKTNTGASTIYITSLAEEDENHLWIGTNTGEGLLKFDFRTQTFKDYQHQPNNNNSLASNNITSILKVSDDSLWIATTLGVSLLNPKTNQFRHYSVFDDKGNIIQRLNIESMLQDSKKRYWLCSDIGLLLFNPKNGQITNFNNKDGKPIKLPNQDTNMAIEDDEGNIWVASYGGLYKIWFDPKGIQLKSYTHDVENSRSICSNRVISLCKMNGEVWIGTENGLAKYIKETDDFDNITSENGLKTPFVVGLAADNANNERRFASVILSKSSVA